MTHCSMFAVSATLFSQCVTVHPVPKFRSCHKAIMVTTGRAHCYILCDNVLVTEMSEEF